MSQQSVLLDLLRDARFPPRYNIVCTDETPPFCRESMPEASNVGGCTYEKSTNSRQYREQAITANPNKARVFTGDDVGVVSRNRPLYNALHEESDVLHKSIRQNIDSVLAKVPRKLSSLLEDQMDMYRAKVEKLIQTNVSRIHRAVMQTEKEPDTHSFVIIAEKEQTGSFQFITALDRAKATKKMNSYRHLDRLLIEFTSESRLTVSRLKNIMRAGNIHVSAKNVFSFDGGHLKDLHAFLDQLLSRWSSHKDEYRVTYAVGESRTVAKKRTGGGEIRGSGAKKRRAGDSDSDDSSATENSDEASEERS